jgi:hypothetical protein
VQPEAGTETTSETSGGCEMRKLGNRITVVLGLCLIVACIGFLVPQCVELARVEQDIRESQALRQRQKAIEPLEADLLRLASQKPEKGLEAPVRAPLEAGKLPRLPELFETPARRTGLALVRLDSNVEGLSSAGYRELDIELTVGGPCSGFQRYLVELCRLPFLAELRHVTIRRTGADSAQMTVAATLSVRG